MTKRLFATPIITLLLILTMISAPVSAGNDDRSPSVAEEAWSVINDPTADFEARAEAERKLMAERDARFLETFLWQMLDDISVPTDADGERSVSFLKAFRHHLPTLPGPELARILPIEAQIAQSRARVVSSLIGDSIPLDVRKAEFQKVLRRALKLEIGQTLESGTIVTEGLRTWLLQNLIQGGAAVNWSPSVSDQLVSVVTDELLPKEVRVSAVNPIIGRARFDPADAASRRAADAVIQYAWEHRGQEFTRRITPPLTSIRDPRTALLLLDWAEFVDPATATVQDAEFVVNRFDWYFDDVSGLYIPHGGEHPRDRRLRQERMEVQRRAVEAGDWAAVREFDKGVLAERRLEAQERHATIMTWIQANRMRLEAEVAGGAADASL